MTTHPVSGRAARWTVFVVSGDRVREVTIYEPVERGAAERRAVRFVESCEPDREYVVLSSEKRS